ncbi:unnamed protein product [Lathyrus oleraceus]|uniref:AP2/ERF domain-containing protein n=1 Tax=Pisum sativum TaxID=3888 RepID=A0A9D4YAI4_PEA|nr:ethylene-responsive transcription factor ERF118-like [Pisum sativum]KAI5436031.1 hypothetical protein KIW84_022461 [Pisum sativum]
MDPPPSRVSRSRRILKIVYDDPDVTDSSSDERNNIVVDKTMRKRVVLEIAFPNVPSDQTVDNELNKNNNSCETTKHEVKQPSCKHRGVRMRKWGRYAAEIRNPINGERIWLGTFDSAEKASKAYEAKRDEFEAIYKKDFPKGKKNKRFKKVSFAEPLVASSNDSERDTSNIPLSSPEFVKNVEVSSDETNSLQKSDIVQQPNVVANVDASSQLESDWLTLDDSELDLGASNKDLGCLDDLNDIDIPFDFDYFGTQFAVYHGIPSSIGEPRKRSSIKELPNIPKQIKEPLNIPGQ